MRNLVVKRKTQSTSGSSRMAAAFDKGGNGFVDTVMCGRILPSPNVTEAVTAASN